MSTADPSEVLTPRRRWWQSIAWPLIGLLCTFVCVVLALHIQALSLTVVVEQETGCYRLLDDLRSRGVTSSSHVTEMLESGSHIALHRRHFNTGPLTQIANESIAILLFAFTAVVIIGVWVLKNRPSS